jgi:hypothetical protein
MFRECCWKKHIHVSSTASAWKDNAKCNCICHNIDYIDRFIGLEDKVFIFDETILTNGRKIKH